MSPFPPTLKIATVWLVLGTLIFLGFEAWQAKQQRMQFRADAAGVVELRRAADGHYHWPGHVNGIAAEFLVDTGATTTALPQALAERAGLTAEGRITSDTAGGMVHGVQARADIDLGGGVRAQNLRVAVLPNLTSPLLGMDVLSRLQLTQGGNVLRLQPLPAGP